MNPDDIIEFLNELSNEVNNTMKTVAEVDERVNRTNVELDAEISAFFNAVWKGSIPIENVGEEKERIMKKIESTETDSDLKLSLLEKLDAGMEKFVAKLDAEIFKIRCNMESENPGVCHKIEQKILEENSELARTDPDVFNRIPQFYTGLHPRRGDKRPPFKGPSKDSKFSSGFIACQSASSSTSQTDSIVDQSVHSTTYLSQENSKKKFKTESHKSMLGKSNIATKSINYKARKRVSSIIVPIKSEPEFEHPEKIQSIKSVEVDDTLYCICRKVSFGAMVCCDNPNCKYQWFHYPCVNLVDNPKGSWYCPDCVEKGFSINEASKSETIKS